MLASLTLTHFRSFAHFHWEPQPGLNFILGPNARGKTSLLEAICFLIRLRSPLTHKPEHLLQLGAEQLTLHGCYNSPQLGESSLGVQLSFSPHQRRLHLHGENINNVSEYLQVGKVIWMSLEDRAIICSHPEKRRLYLDSIGLQSDGGYRHALRNYHQALRSRNILLRQKATRAQIEAYDPLLIKHGHYLLQSRSQLVRALEPYIAKSCHAISREILSLSFLPGATMSLKEALAHSRPQEERLGYTTVGPHRDELKISLNGLEAATFASEGQKRTVALSLKLGAASFFAEKIKQPPLLLLDDIFGELDQGRREALLANLHSSEQPYQIFLTTTEGSVLELPRKANTLYL